MLTKVTLLISVCFTVGITQGAWAQDAKSKQPEAKQDSGSDRVDIKKLEEQYWSSKDDDFTVVQNRAYPKAGRFYGSLSYGMVINDGFSTGKMFTANAGYYFSEKWGVEFDYTNGSLVNNATTDFFIDRYGAIPDHNMFSSSKTVSAVFVPFYAKMSFLEKKIIYFDMSIGLGLGMTDYTILQDNGDIAKSAPHFALNISQQFFISNSFALRVDYKNKFTNEDRSRYTLGANASRDLSSQNVNDTQLMVGVTIFMGGK